MAARPHRPWSPDDDARLLAIGDRANSAQAAVALGRSRRDVVRRHSYLVAAQGHGPAERRPWTPADDAELTRLHGARVPQHANGGIVRGPGGARDDRVLARLSPGEFVINAGATGRHRAVLEAINRGDILPGYAGGGAVGSAFSAASQSVSTTKRDVADAVEQGTYQAFRRALDERDDRGAVTTAGAVMAAYEPPGAGGSVPGPTIRTAPNLRYNRQHQAFLDPLPHGLRGGEIPDRHPHPLRPRRGPVLVGPSGPERPMPEGAGRTDPGSLKGSIFSGESGGQPGIFNHYSGGRLLVGHFDADSMTIGELQRRQRAGEIFAAGKYQIIPKTMQGAIDSLHLRPEDKFDSVMQDKIYTDWLAGAKHPSIGAYVTGQSNDLIGANDAVAHEWSSVASPFTGRSVYPKDHASVSAERIQSALRNARGLYQRLIGEGIDPETARRAALLGIEHPSNVRRQQDDVPSDHHADAVPGDRLRFRGDTERHTGLLQPYADEGERGFAAQQREAERAVLPRRPPATAPADMPERHAGIDMRVSGLDELREAHGHVDALHRKIAGLSAVNLKVRHEGFGHGGDHAPGAVRTVLNGNFGSDGRRFS